MMSEIVVKILFTVCFGSIIGYYIYTLHSIGKFKNWINHERKSFEDVKNTEMMEYKEGDVPLYTCIEDMQELSISKELKESFVGALLVTTEGNLRL